MFIYCNWCGFDVQPLPGAVFPLVPSSEESLFGESGVCVCVYSVSLFGGEEALE